MGVKGLWSLLNPVARPVQIESLEGKRLAIDSSIWLYQFQSTMRDKDGRVLVNAHVLGFLRRINRLLFHGIKPVFVFDGGAPALKRSTIAERKRRKAGAQQNHAKMAEKLLAAQMRREAVRLAQEAESRREARAAQRATMVMDNEVGDQIRENEVYLDELEGRARPPPTATTTANTSAASITETPDERRKRFKKSDRYQLPEVDMPSYSTDSRPDARLATEAELQQFINEVAPEDIDVESPEFRALPTEVQYEIIGDLRVRSRQPSGKRLTDMLSRAPTALDFSKEQIKNLSQRNDLTQKLLTVTDMVGKAHLTIPVRVASERNRQYVLVKRGEDEGGGWALGIREGTQEKPIVLEPESKPRVEESDSDYSDEVEEVVPVDDELRQHRRREVLEAIAKRCAPAKPARTLDIPAKSFGPAPKEGAQPLFEAAEGVEEDSEDEGIIPTANDEALALALQQEELGSDEDEADPVLARALALSRQEAAKPPSETDSDEFEEVSVAPSGVATPHESIVVDDSEDEFEVVEVKSAPQRAGSVTRDKVVDLVSDDEQPVTTVETGSAQSIMAALARPSRARPQKLSTPGAARPVTSSFQPVDHAVAGTAATSSVQQLPRPASRPQATPSTSPQGAAMPVRNGATEQMAQPPSPVGRASPSSPPRPARVLSASPEPRPAEEPPSPRFAGAPSPSPEPIREASILPMTADHGKPPSPPWREEEDSDEFVEVTPDAELSSQADVNADFEETQLDTPEDFEETQVDSLPPAHYHSGSEDEDAIPWSRSPSPVRRKLGASESSLQVAGGSEPVSDGEMNAAEMEQEEDDYARFIAQIKNRDLNEVRTEIDDEIRILNQHTKAAMRDSDEITQTMVVQVQTLLKHYGIPYVTAPMEAEAQCAKLAELNLVDGIITDDSDVFLFGGTQCFKNIFNEAKYAEVFSATDIERELSLTRERLISLSYLLGSDYTIGLPGIGPVMALELMSNFPGSDGLERFKEWWMKVQRGQDLPVEANTDWKRRFKKRFGGSLFLTNEWLSPYVREAYLHPTCDESDEPFHWGFPRLAALRTYLHEELSWSITKVDDELTPIVQRIAQRGRGGIPRQTTLLPFFDHNAATGANFAPRRRTTANVSKRLLSVIKEFREAEARAQGQQPTGLGEMLSGVDAANPKGVVKRTKSAASIIKDKDEDADSENEAEPEPEPRPKRRKTAETGKGKRKRASRATTTSTAAGSDADPL